MYIGYSIPTPSVIALVGAGAAMLTPSADLFNARCQDVTRLQWLSGAQTTASVLKLQFTLPVATVVGMCGLVGLNLRGLASSAGLKVVFTGKRAGDADYTYALGGNSATQRTVLCDDKSYKALCICDTGLTAIVGWQLAIYNDQTGAANIAAGGLVDIGKPFACPAFDVDIDGDWSLTPPSSNVPQSPNGQPWPNPYPPGRVLTFAKTLMDYNAAYITGATPSWQALCTLAGNGDASIMIPRWGKTGALDTASIHATGVFGIAKFGEIRRAKIGGDKYSITGTSQEVPSLLA